MSAAADPALAPGMQAYMKSSMPYHGLRSARVDEICKKVFAGRAGLNRAANGVERFSSCERAEPARGAREHRLDLAR
jgi:3-methyladenine DNA glycosylase AlkD